MSTTFAAHPRSARLQGVIGIAVPALLWVAAMAIVTPAIRTPPHVDRLTIDNPHPWDVHVEATDADRDGWVGIARVGRDDRHTVESVLDQGDTWVIRFSYAGQSAESRLDRAELERDDWQVTVPDQLADRLRAAGIPETPL